MSFCVFHLNAGIVMGFHFQISAVVHSQYPLEKDPVTGAIYGPIRVKEILGALCLGSRGKIGFGDAQPEVLLHAHNQEIRIGNPAVCQKNTFFVGFPLLDYQVVPEKTQYALKEAFLGRIRPCTKRENY